MDGHQVEVSDIGFQDAGIISQGRKYGTEQHAEDDQATAEYAPAAEAHEGQGRMVQDTAA